MLYSETKGAFMFLCLYSVSLSRARNNDFSEESKEAHRSSEAAIVRAENIYAAVVIMS